MKSAHHFCSNHAQTESQTTQRDRIISALVELNISMNGLVATELDQVGLKARL